MARARISLLAALAAGLGAGPPARASGFHLPEQSAEALAKAGAHVASARGPDAAWANPAALAFAGGPAAALTGAVADLRSRFDPRDAGPRARSAPGPRALPALFAALPIGRRLALGLSLGVPFGLDVAWPAGWRGDVAARSLRISAVDLQPSLALRLSERVAVAAFASARRSAFAFSAALPVEAGGTLMLSGAATGFAAGAALLVRSAGDRARVGAVYRSRSRHEVSARARFSDVRPAFAGSYPDQAAAVSFTLPDHAAIGASVDVGAGAALDLQIDRTFWTTFDEVPIAFSVNTTPDQVVAQRTRDAWGARLGAAWALPRVAAALRAGLLAEQSATTGGARNPATPDGPRLGVAVGGGYALGRLQIDAGYLFLALRAARSTDARPGAPPAGTYRGRAHALALTVTVR